MRFDLSANLSSPSRMPSANGHAAASEPPVPARVSCPPFVTAGVPNYSDTQTVLLNRMVDAAETGDWLVLVGVYHGFDLRHLAHRAKASGKNLTVVGVDWGRGSPEHADQLASMQYGNLASAMLATLTTAGLADYVKLIIAPSVEAAKLVPDGCCAMIFIDGDHSYAGVLADIESWLPKVKRGGFLAGHDWPTYPGVRQAVREVFGAKNHMCLDANTCWAVQVGKYFLLPLTDKPA